VGARDFDGIGIAALGRQALALVPAYPELLGKVSCVLRIVVGGAHDLPA
jgi:hypothetical protein